MPSVFTTDDSLETKVIKQLEYYFSDINLRNDYFIKNLAKKDSGWISIETLMKFNRLKSLVNNDMNLLIKTLKTLRSDLIECHPNGGKLRRRIDRPVPKMDDDLKRSFKERSLEVKGFPKETTLDELMKWSQQFGSVLSIQMNRLKISHKFDGCAIFTFAEKEMVETVINQKPLKFKDMELIKETKSAQNECKRDIKASETSGIILVNKMETVSMDNTNGTAIGMEGTVLQLKGMPRRVVAKEKKKKSNRIKEFFAGYGKVVYVSSDSSGNCLIQFSDRSSALRVLKYNMVLIGKEIIYKILFYGKEVTVQLLSEEEELAFWIRAKKRKEKKNRRKDLKKRLKEECPLLRKRANSSLNSEQDPKRMTPAIA